MADLSTILSTDCRGSFVGYGGIELLVNTRGWEPGTDEQAIIAGEVPATRLIATQDGRHADLRGWHEGPSGGEVYFERYSTRGRESHGWIDAISRKIVQTG